MRRRSEPLTAPGSADRPSAGVDSLQRGLDILRCFRPGEDLLSAGEIARRMGLSRLTALRLLDTLADHDFLLRGDAPESYGLHVGCFALGQAVLAGSGLVRAARAPLQALADRHSVHTVMAIGERDGLLVLAHFAGVAAAAWRLGAGARLSVTDTAPGLAWLWAQPPQAQARWMTGLREEGKAGALAAMWRAFHALETGGVCMTNWPDRPGMHWIAAPLVMHDGPVAVVACARHEDAPPARPDAALVSALRDTAAMIRDTLPRAGAVR